MILLKNLTVQSMWLPGANWHEFFWPDSGWHGVGWNLGNWVVRITWDAL